jgi:HPt (histidine-containing phosphotransfer) domain-containing protein
MDYERLLKNTGGNPQLANTILKKIEVQLNQFEEVLQSLLQSNEMDDAYQFVHKTKSGVAYLFDHELTANLNQLEIALSNKQKESITSIFQQVMHRISAIKSELESYL